MWGKKKKKRGKETWYLERGKIKESERVMERERERGENDSRLVCYSQCFPNCCQWQFLDHAAADSWSLIRISSEILHPFNCLIGTSVALLNFLTFCTIFPLGRWPRRFSFPSVYCIHAVLPTLRSVVVVLLCWIIGITMVSKLWMQLLM